MRVWALILGSICAATLSVTGVVFPVVRHAALAQEAPPAWRYYPVEGVGGGRVVPSSISADGWIVGTAETQSGWTVFRWKPGDAQIENVIPPDALGGFITDINDVNRAVGTVEVLDGFRPTVWEADGSTTTLRGLGGRAAAVAISDSGWIIGWSHDQYGQHRAVRWAPGLLDPVVLQPVPGASHSSVSALHVNESGWVAGLSDDGHGNQHAVVWIPGTSLPTDLGTLGGRFSSPRDINDSGSVTGIAGDSNDEYRAFVWAPGDHVVRDLTPERPSNGSPFTFVSSAVALNSAGVVVGYYNSNRPFLWRPGDPVASPLPTLHPDGTATPLTINDSGRVLGQGDAADWPQAPISWSPQGEIDGLPFPPGEYASTAVMNADGVAAGQLASPTLDTRLIVWYPQDRYVVVDGGFSDPIHQPPLVNLGRAGRTYPLEWRLSDPAGLPVTDLAVVVSFGPRSTSCATLMGIGIAYVEAGPLGGSGVQVESSTGSFKVNWKTPRDPGCYEFSVVLNDGSRITALFDLR